MKILSILVVTRVVETAGPEQGEPIDEFLQAWREGMVDDPFSFIDTADAVATAFTSIVQV